MTAIFLNEVRGGHPEGPGGGHGHEPAAGHRGRRLHLLDRWIVSRSSGFSGFAGLAGPVRAAPPLDHPGHRGGAPDRPGRPARGVAALAAPEWRTVWSVVLPTARSGMITAVLLGIAVAIGETAPLLLTIFGATLMNANPFHGAQSALAPHRATQRSQAHACSCRPGLRCRLLLLIWSSCSSSSPGPRCLGPRAVGPRSNTHGHRRLRRTARRPRPSRRCPTTARPPP